MPTTFFLTVPKKQIRRGNPSLWTASCSAQTDLLSRVYMDQEELRGAESEKIESVFEEIVASINNARWL